MKKIIPVILGCSLTVASFIPAFAQNNPETKKEKISYSIGLQMGLQLSTLGDHVDVQSVINGLNDGQSGTKSKLSEEEIKMVMTEFQTEMQAEQQKKTEITSTENGKEASTFLAENKGKDGVITLDSGLQYKILNKGEGASPLATDTVTVHYRGTLVNGTEFDSSYKRNEPATFPVSGVIKGWTEALQLMQVGSKWQLFLPAELAYGNRGAGRDIGPNQMLIFEVELLEIKKSE